MEMALEQIQRTTGLQAIILIGGPAPAMANDITTQLCVACSLGPANVQLMFTIA